MFLFTWCGYLFLEVIRIMDNRGFLYTLKRIKDRRKDEVKTTYYKDDRGRTKRAVQRYNPRDLENNLVSGVWEE